MQFERSYWGSVNESSLAVVGLGERQGYEGELLQRIEALTERVALLEKGLVYQDEIYALAHRCGLLEDFIQTLRRQQETNGEDGISSEFSSSRHHRDAPLIQPDKPSSSGSRKTHSPFAFKTFLSGFFSRE